MDFDRFIADLAGAVMAVDATRPIATSSRTGTAYQPGIGPHPETRTVQLLAGHIAGQRTEYADFSLGVSYPEGRRMACDYCLGSSGAWQWAIEFKMLRLMGDNGKPNDNMLMHVLSPYPAHRSALTDCAKLANSTIGDRRGVVIYGYDYPGWSMDLAIDAFEVLAKRTVDLGERQVAAFSGLIHPVHQEGRVFGWEIGRPVS